MKQIMLIIIAFMHFFKISAEDMNTIKTNATCKTGQEKIKEELSKLEGVFDVQFSTDGTITINYSSDGTPYNEIVKKITECGFKANNIEPKNYIKNVCEEKSK